MREEIEELDIEGGRVIERKILKERELGRKTGGREEIGKEERKIEIRRERDD